MRTLPALLVLLAALPALAGKQGEWVQSDNVGMNLVTHDFTADATRTVADATVLSEFIGLHYFVVDGVRVGMNFQFSEQFQPEPAAGKTRWATFALLPQIGFDLGGPFFAAAVFTVAPRTGGEWRLDLGVQGVLGAGFRIAEGVKLNVAAEVPVNFHIHTTIGFTPLVGVSFRL